MRAMLERGYLGVLGYRHYARGEHEEADRAMVRAWEVFAAALERCPFLVVLADDAFDLRLHRARVARGRRRWDEMRAHAEAAVAMREGRLPYHVFPDGTAVTVGTLAAFLDALPVPASAQPLRPHLQDEALRRENTERSIRAVYRLPGWVIEV